MTAQAKTLFADMESATEPLFFGLDAAFGRCNLRPMVVTVTLADAALSFMACRYQDGILHLKESEELSGRLDHLRAANRSTVYVEIGKTLQGRRTVAGARLLFIVCSPRQDRPFVRLALKQS